MENDIPLSNNPLHVVCAKKAKSMFPLSPQAQASQVANAKKAKSMIPLPSPSQTNESDADEAQFSVYRSFSLDNVVENGVSAEVEGVADQFEIWCKMNSTHASSSFDKKYTGKTGAARRKYLFTTGFLRKEYVFETSKKRASAPTVLDVDFMRNWTYSWNFLVLQSEQKPTSFQAVSPLLNACVTIFFDKSLMRFMTILSVYCIACDIGICWLYAQDSWYYVADAFVIGVLLFSVWQGCYVLKGSKPVVVSNRRYQREVLLSSHLTVIGSIKMIAKYFMGYLRSLSVKSDACDEDRERKVRKSGDYQTEGFLEVCHTTTEYLLSVGNSYKWLDKTLAEPEQSDIESGIELAAMDETAAKSTSVPVESERSLNGRPNRGSVVEAAPEVIIAMPSFPVFHPRRYTNVSIVFSIILFPLCFLCNFLMSVTYYLPTCTRHEADAFPQPRCHNYWHYSSLTLWFAIPNFVYAYLMVSLAVVLSSLLYGADLANALAVNWNLRFLPLRRTGQSDRLVEPECETEEAIVDEDQQNLQLLRDKSLRSFRLGQIEKEELMKSVSWVKLVSLMNRDAIERYLFMHHYFNLCSAVWSPYLAICFVVCGVSFVYNYALLIFILYTQHTLSAGTLLTVISSVILFVLLLVALSYANAAADTIWRAFNGAGKDDFQIIGGRDAWRDYVSGSPIQWTVFGVAVTRKMLVSSAIYLLSFIVPTLFIAVVRNRNKIGSIKGM
jgi:hypothetical protein